MKLVDSAVEAPGSCVLSGRADGPFVQLDRLREDGLGTAYVRVAVVEEMAELLGLVPQHRRLPVSERDALMARAEAAEQEHHELLQAVGHTLKHGAVVRKGKVELRKPYDARGRIIKK